VNFTQLDLLPLQPGYGQIWQGGTIDETLFNLPGPLVVVSMTGGQEDAQWLFQSRVMTPRRASDGMFQGVINVEIADLPESILPDNVYLGLIDACCGYLRNGVNLYVHCRMGISRSTYVTAGIYMRLLNLSLKEALQKIQGRRQRAELNWGFEQHLQILEGKLRS
jgi:hypothetical protein